MCSFQIFEPKPISSDYVIYLLEHVFAELQLLHQALAAILNIHPQQSLISQLLPSRNQSCLQLNTTEVKSAISWALVCQYIITLATKGSKVKRHTSWIWACRSASMASRFFFSE